MADILMNYLKILRPINLLIVALTQYSIFFLLLSPFFQEHGFTPVLGQGMIHLFVLVTLCITATGFIINDIVDYDIDILNKPDKIFIGDDKISFASAKQYYWIVAFIGLLLSIFIGYNTDKLNLVVIYPISVALLYFYSTIFKGKMLVGNLVVAIFSMFVSGIIFFAEWANISELASYNSTQYLLITKIAVAYMLFGFFSSMYREIIKDIEDHDGDKKLGLSTLPIKVGISNAKAIAIVMITCLSANYYNWYTMITYTQNQSLYYTLLVALMIIPTLFIAFKTISAKPKKDFHNLSQWTKGLMLASIILFVVICILH